MYFIGIDIGTSGTKTVLFDAIGNTVASAVEEYPLYQPHAGWAEQEPEDWWRAVAVTVKAVIGKSGVDPKEIKGVGLSGQMHGLVMLDKSGKVLRRSIIWCDQRTTLECDEITGKVGAGRLVEITANPALTGFTASKILWVRNNEPKIYDQCAKILLPKDYIRYKLTGEFAAEVSDGSGMQLMDIRSRCWSEEVLGKLQIDRALLGKMYESPEVTGMVTNAAAADTGLAEGTIVVGGAGDQAAAAVGAGIVKTGIVSSTIGTSGVVFAHSDDVQIDLQGRVHTFCHAVPGKWHIMGVTQGAGLSLKWFRDNFCQVEVNEAQRQNVDPYVLMDKQAEPVPAGSNGVIYLPYLMGERTPHLDPNAKGVFFGLTASSTREDMLRSGLEGVSFSLLDCLSVIREMGISASSVRAGGGGGRSTLWRQMQADMFGCDVVTVNSSEGGALGAALLAAVGAGTYKSVEEACGAAIAEKSKTLPQGESRSVYMKQYEVYKRIYRNLRELF